MRSRDIHALRLDHVTEDARVLAQPERVDGVVAQPDPFAAERAQLRHQRAIIGGDHRPRPPLQQRVGDGEREFAELEAGQARVLRWLDHGGIADRERRTLSEFKAPVRIETLGGLDMLESDAQTSGPGIRELGSVTVTMSAEPIFKARLGALGLAVALVLGVAIASCLIAWRLTRRLRLTMSAVLAALRDIRRGQFQVRLDIAAPDELGELQRTIVQMADALGTAREDLERQVRSRTHELSQAIEQVRQADAEKRRLITHSNALIEDDRKRVAVEIHDHLGASLISVRLEASALAAHAQSSGHAELARSAQRIADTVQGLYTSTRNIVQSLRPEVLDTLGLAGAIEELVEGLDRVHPDCRFHVRIAPDLPAVPSELAMQAYRVAQESLTNIVKHAQATEAWVTLSPCAEGRQLCMEIRDNGRGFDTQTSTRVGLGLIGMRERVASVGGEISVSAPRSQGTTITVTLPLHRPQA